MESRRNALGNEMNLSRILEEFEFTMEQFVDLCILLGCDYYGSIRGIGPKKAFELIQKHKDIETVLENIDTAKYHPEVENADNLNVGFEKIYFYIP